MGDWREITLYFDPAQRDKVEAFLRSEGALDKDKTLEAASPCHLELNYGGVTTWDNCPADIVLLARIGQGDYGAFCAFSPEGEEGARQLEACSETGAVLVHVDWPTLGVHPTTVETLTTYKSTAERLGVDLL